jgi:hypothetical protein
MITIRLDGIESIQNRLRTLGTELERGQAMQAAINKTAAKAQTEINRAIREEYVVKAEEVRNAITIRRAQKGRLEAEVQIFGSKNKRGRSANMIHFLAAVQAAGAAVKARGAAGVKKKDLKGLGKQIGFQIKRGGGLKQKVGAFIGNKGRTVFIRTGDARLPIKPVQVIGFSQMFNSRKISERVLAKVRADLLVETDRAIKMILARRT